MKYFITSGVNVLYERGHGDAQNRIFNRRLTVVGWSMDVAAGLCRGDLFAKAGINATERIAFSWSCAATGAAMFAKVLIPGARLVVGLLGGHFGPVIFDFLNDRGININFNTDPNRDSCNHDDYMIHPPHSPGPIVLPNNDIPTDGSLFAD